MRQTLATLITATTLSIQPTEAQETNLQANHPYVGMWVTDDNRVRHELLPNGRDVEARGARERAYEGRYEVEGTHIESISNIGTTRVSQPTAISSMKTPCTTAA